MEDYTWKLKGLAKGVDPSVAVAELNRLRNIYGELTPELIVRESAKKKSPLYTIFEWDNDKAAHNWRLQQARILLNNIQVTVLSDGEPKKIDVFEVTTVNEGYKNIDSFTPSDIEYVKTSTRNQLIAIRTKLKIYDQFDKVVTYLSQAIEEIN